MDRPQGYRLIGYGALIDDRIRMAAYAEALQRAIRPGSIVLDLGAGTGIFSLLSLQFGAGRVHAVEPHEAIGVARRIAQENGCAGRVTFHQALSTEIDLPSRADVIISDLRGVLPLFQRHIPSIVDARRRHLAPGGRLIPQCDTIWVSLVEAPELYRRFERPWVKNDWGLKMQAGHALVVNTWCRVNLAAERLLVEPQRWVTLDYREVDSPHVDARLNWTAGRPGTAHGLLVWFETELLDGLGFGNAPGQPELIYGQAFFPLQEPVPLAAGDQVCVRLAANLVGGDYVWRWETDVCSPAAGVASSPAPPKPRLRLRQSTFLGGVLELEQLRRSEADCVPQLSARGRADGYILALIDGQRTLGEVARQAAAEFPQQFPRWQDALTRAAQLVRDFGG